MTTQIVIDTGRASTLNSGLGQVVYQFAAGLDRLAPEGLTFVFLLHRSMVGQFTAQFGFPIITAGGFRRLMPEFFSTGDIWHVLNPDSRSVPLNHSGLMTTIHDLRILHVKNAKRSAAYRHQLQRMLDHSCLLTAISDYTRQEVVSHFRVPKVPFTVIHNGTAFPDQSSADSAPELEAPYLFAIGLFEAKKRFHLLVEMMAHIPDYNLILAGNCNNDYGQQVSALVEKLGLLKRVQLVGEVDDATKWRYYAKASALVFPSSLEGFGLPLLEAMAMGTLVISSADGALRETGGDQAIYFKSLNPVDMANQVVTAVNNDSPQRRDERRCYARSFSWDKSVAAYINAYRSIAAQKQ